jgi:hypothetical protein
MGDREPDRWGENAEEVQYDPSSSRYDLFECPDCDNIVLALGRDDPPMS